MYYCTNDLMSTARPFQVPSYTMFTAGHGHGVTYYYFTYHCFIEYVCDYVMSTYINGHGQYCLLKRDGATRWTRCDKL